LPDNPVTCAIIAPKVDVMSTTTSSPHTHLLHNLTEQY
jgi:hypothetical protein